MNQQSRSKRRNRAPFEPLIASSEAARVLGISPRKLWELTNRGEIPRVDHGPRCIRYRPEDLRSYVERRTTSRG
jgi:excisionase family DNA binding protein